MKRKARGISAGAFMAGFSSAGRVPEWFEDECRCRFSGDSADASACPLHSKPRESAVKIDGCGEGYDTVPF